MILLLTSGKALDDIANNAARIRYLENIMREKSDELDRLRFDADSWKERLSELQVVDGRDVSQASHLRQSIIIMRNALYRLQRQEKMTKLKNDIDAVELEVLRHDLNYKQSVC